MDYAIIPREHSKGEAPKLSPLEAFVAWLATFLRTIAGLIRRTVFPPNWKDHWPGLRELEWYRDQILAFSASHVLAGGSLDDRTDFQLVLDVPDTYGVCPHTPQTMNRRFIAMAQFRLDPDKYIQRHIRRIARAARTTSPALRANKDSSVLACAKTGLSRRGAAKTEGGNRPPCLTTHARAPPYSPLPTAHCPLPIASLATPAKTPPLA